MTDEPGGADRLRIATSYLALLVGMALLVDTVGMVSTMAYGRGAYGFLGYGMTLLIPVYFPALVVSLILIAVYGWHGRRERWRLFAREKLFAAIFVVSTFGKLVTFALIWIFQVDPWPSRPF